MAKFGLTDEDVTILVYNVLEQMNLPQTEMYRDYLIKVVRFVETSVLRDAKWQKLD